MERLFIAGLALAQTACQNMPESYAPPVQRQPLENFRPYGAARIVNMDDGNAEAHFISDILFLDGNWRWTSQRPAVRITPSRNENLGYLIDFAIAEATFKETGPVQVSFFVNDHVLDTRR